MTVAHILIELFFAVAGIAAVVSIARDLRREWHRFLDTLGDQ